MTQTPTIIFVCEHGAAKSVVAAAHFNKLAGEMNLNIRAIARGTTPDAELSPKTVEGLKNDGLTPTESAPHKLSLADIESAQRVVAFCNLPEEYQSKAPTEQWNDVPPVSEDYEKARDAIVEKINQLIENIS
jgi:protein-tyrosine-phosphatase